MRADILWRAGSQARRERDVATITLRAWSCPAHTACVRPPRRHSLPRDSCRHVCFFVRRSQPFEHPSQLTLAASSARRLQPRCLCNGVHRSMSRLEALVSLLGLTVACSVTRDGLLIAPCHVYVCRSLLVAMYGAPVSIFYFQVQHLFAVSCRGSPLVTSPFPPSY